MFLERQLYLSFLLPCSWICCWSVYTTLFPLRFSFWLLVGSTSLVPVGPFLLHAVLAVDMLQCVESQIKWEIEWNWSLQIGTFSKRSSPDKFPPILLDPRLALPIPEATKEKVIWWALKRYLRICNGCGPGWLILIDYMELTDQMMTYMAAVCAFPAINDLWRAAVAWTKRIPILNSLPYVWMKKRSTVRPSDRQVLSSELNSALRSELQVLGALQALLNLIRLSTRTHSSNTTSVDTSLTPTILNLLLADLQSSSLWMTSKIHPSDKPVFCELEECPSHRNDHCDIPPEKGLQWFFTGDRHNIPPEGAFFSISSMSSKYSIYATQRIALTCTEN